MKKLISSFILISLFLFSVAVYGKKIDDSSKIIPKLIDVGSHRCVPCRKMEPILEELTEEYEGVFDVEFLDVMQSKNKKMIRKYEVKAIPTQIFLDEKGKKLWRHEGFLSKEDILNKWKELGYTFEPKSNKE